MSRGNDFGEVRTRVREYILKEFLPDEDPATLTDETPLISSGILDSIANAKLVTFLEEEFDIRFSSSEIRAENLDTVARIIEAVERKRGREQ